MGCLNIAGYKRQTDDAQHCLMVSLLVSPLAEWPSPSSLKKVKCSRSSWNATIDQLATRTHQWIYDEQIGGMSSRKPKVLKIPSWEWQNVLFVGSWAVVSESGKGSTGSIHLMRERTEVRSTKRQKIFAAFSKSSKSESTHASVKSTYTGQVFMLSSSKAKWKCVRACYCKSFSYFITIIRKWMAEWLNAFGRSWIGSATLHFKEEIASVRLFDKPAGSSEMSHHIRNIRQKMSNRSGKPSNNAKKKKFCNNQARYHN